MSNRTDVYRAITPLGIVEVEFPEDGGSLMEGDPLAVAYLRDVIGLQTGSLGMTMSPSSLEPDDFEAFCQPPGSHVVIIAPIDAMGDEEPGAVLDAVSPMDAARIAADVARKLAELQAATGLQRARIAGELAAMVAPDSVSIYNSDNGEPAAKEPTMETTAPTMDRNETEARNLLAAGFKTKADQKRAKDAATQAFGRVMQAVRNVHLEDRDNPKGEAVYFDMPMYPHEWRPRHAAMIRADLPGAAVHIDAADRIAALAKDIKEAPLMPTVAEEKARKERAALAIQELNPALKAAFEAQAPDLAAEFESYMRSTYAALQKNFPDGVPAYLESRSPYRHEVALLQTVCDIRRKEPAVIGSMDHIMVLDEGALTSRAEAYGLSTALQWFYKTNQKLGDLQSPVLVKDRDGYVHVKGERDGKKVELVQQRIINVSPLGKLFHQFPSRIYLDGKFMTEEAYAKLFPPAA